MRITEAARRLGTSPRMLRYREDLGLLPRVRDRFAGPFQPGGSRGPSRRQSGGLAPQLGAASGASGAASGAAALDGPSRIEQ